MSAPAATAVAAPAVVSVEAAAPTATPPPPTATSAATTATATARKPSSSAPALTAAQRNGERFFCMLLDLPRPSDADAGNDGHGDDDDDAADSGDDLSADDVSDSDEDDGDGDGDGAEVHAAAVAVAIPRRPLRRAVSSHALPTQRALRFARKRGFETAGCLLRDRLDTSHARCALYVHAWCARVTPGDGYVSWDVLVRIVVESGGGYWFGAPLPAPTAEERPDRVLLASLPGAVQALAERGSGGRTAFCAAVSNGHAELARAVLDVANDEYALFRDHGSGASRLVDSAVHDVVQHYQGLGDAALLTRPLLARASVKALNAHHPLHGLTPLFAALRWMNGDAVSALLDRVPDVDLSATCVPRPGEVGVFVRGPRFLQTSTSTVPVIGAGREHDGDEADASASANSMAAEAAGAGADGRPMGVRAYLHSRGGRAVRLFEPLLTCAEARLLAYRRSLLHVLQPSACHGLHTSVTAAEAATIRDGSVGRSSGSADDGAGGRAWLLPELTRLVLDYVAGHPAG